VPIVLTNQEWIETWRANGEGHVFPGAPAQWTADQKRLISVTKEYAAAFTALAARGHEAPGEHVLSEYREFRKWWNAYSKDPKAADDPYQKYNRGFRKR